jgi:hypothetical protein
MAADRSLIFKLNGKRPEELSIERLALYIKTLGELVGSSAFVRAKGVGAGSVEVSLVVKPAHYAALVERLTTAQNPKLAPTTVSTTVRELEEMITVDRVTAEVRAGRTKLLYLRGYTRDGGQAVGPVVQRYSVRGHIIGLEGKDATKHARIAEFGSTREIHGDFRTDDVADKLHKYLWKGVVEVSGVARWMRHADGQWELKTFRIEDAQPLSDVRPSEFLRDLREAIGEGVPPSQLVKASKSVRE